MIEGQRCLVTGGAGTIGSTIVDQLVEAGAGDVIVLDNFVRGRAENLAGALGSGKVAIVEGDIRDRRQVTAVMEGIDLVFHQAAIRITQCAEEPRLALEVLVDGTYEVVEAAANAGVRKVVAASSASVYGLATRFPTSEQHHPYANDTLYGAAKTFNEGLLRSFYAMRGLDYVALRYFNVYGPRMDVHGLYTEVLIRWMERIEAGEPPLILGDGTQTMDFVYTEDIARANLLAAVRGSDRRGLQHRQRDRDQPHRARRALLRAMDSDLPLEFGPPRGVNAVTRRLADVSRAESDWAGRPRRAWTTACGNWWRGGGSSDGRAPMRRATPRPETQVTALRSGRSRMIPVMRPWLGAEEAAAAAEAVASGWVAQGPRVAEFEQAFASTIGAGHAVAVSSCTAALHLALVVAGVGPGDEVVVPSLSFIATANAARHVGAVPVFADVDEATQNLTPATVEPCLTPRTRAVILVDQAGVPADLDAMRALCEPRGITVVEDAACAVGSATTAGPSAPAPSWLRSPSTRASCSPPVKAGCS